MSTSWLIFLLLLRICTGNITQLAQLTPNTSTSHEAHINLLKDVTRNSNTWQILPLDDIGFHLQLSLDKSKWAFHHTKTSKIILQITIDTINTNNNLLISFTQNTNSYITIASIPNIIYPACDNTWPYNQIYANGNITSKLSINNTNNRILKATNNTYTYNTSQALKLNTSVLTYTLENHPLDNYMLLTANTEMQCGYIAMIPHTSLNILFAAIEIGNIFTIKSVNITHEMYDSTPSPILTLDDITTTNMHTNMMNSTDMNIFKDTATQAETQNKNGKIVANKFDNIILIAMAIIMFSSIILCLFDIFHSKLPNGFYRCYGCNRSDQMNYFTIFLYCLAMCNILSDIYISCQIIQYFVDNHNNGIDFVLFVAAFSIVFIIIPYIVNFVSMINVPKFESVSKGPIEWFNQYFLFFIFLGFISCDCYLSVTLIKSHIFGMSLFNSGHTSIELKKIRCVKIATIWTQNIPQIIIQLTFGIILLNELSIMIIVSILISICVSIPFIFSWALGSANNRLSFYKQYIMDVTLIAPKKNTLGISISNDITHESSMINRYSGYKRILHVKLCEILGVNTSKLEIGFIDYITNEGYKIHIIHKVASMDGDITKLYNGKYEIIGKELKNIYHISLEWKIFVSVTVFDKNQNMEMIHKNNENNTTPFHELAQQTPISEINDIKSVINTITTDQRSVAIAINVNNTTSTSQNANISSLQNNVGSLILLNEQIAGQEQTRNNNNNNNEIAYNTENRDRIDTEISDIFGVGGNDNLDNPFEVQIVVNNNNKTGDLMPINHNIIDYEEDGSSTD